VQVTLQILTALIEKVPRDLLLYARSVLTILHTILRSQEITMVEETLPTFETFCRHQDMATLAADNEYITLYRDVVRTYAQFASVDSGSLPKMPAISHAMKLRWKTVALQAIKSVVSSETLAADGANQLYLILPVILQNLFTGGDFTLSPLQKRAQTSEKFEREQARRRRMSIATVQTVDTIDANPDSASGTAADADKVAEVEVRVLALRSLEKIFTSGSNRGQIHLAISLVLDFIVSRNPPREQNPERGPGPNTSGSWATHLLEAIVNWTPVQDRFTILLTLIESLTIQPPDDHQLDPQLTLASLVDWLLCSPINLIGLSVVDVLLELLQHLLLVLRHESRTPTRRTASEAPNSQESDSGEAASTSDPELTTSSEKGTENPRRELQELLQKCIGDLATHIYYADQVTDMVRTTISKIKPSIPLEEAGKDTNTAKAANLGKESYPREIFFNFPAARVSALNTVKDILTVANLRKSMTGTDSNSRNRVALPVWEGTQWLFRESDRDVRHAYVDAFLSWLQLETTKNDLRVPAELPKLSKIGAGRHAGETPETSARRAASHASHRETKAAATATSTFLQSLHLAIYEIATDASTTEADILVLHLLLANLVEHMGVNAARHGLPVMMRLQEDCLREGNGYTPTQVFHIASLVHGYLCALVEKFDLEGTKVGNEIITEITKRKQRGIWLEKIQLPPRPLAYIAPVLDSTVNQMRSSRSTRGSYAPFTSVHDLVAQIESSYTTSCASPPASPATSPARGFSISPFGQNYTSQPASKVPTGAGLPSTLKDQMMASWSKEACIAALENEQAKTASLSGSRAGTGFSGLRNNRSVVNGFNVGNGSHGATDSPPGHRNQGADRPASASHSFSDAAKGGRRSVHEGSRTQWTTSSRDSTVRVNELRRVLSVVKSNNLRRPSPLRGRQRVGSDVSSADSMVTGSFAASDFDVSADSQRDDSETLKASTAALANGGDDESQESSDRIDRRHSDDVPPVPPLPSSLAIPGGFPEPVTGSPYVSPLASPVRSERPRTAPSASAATNGGSASTIKQRRSFTKQKPSSQHGYVDTATGQNRVPAGLSKSGSISDFDQRKASTTGSRTFSLGRRADVEKLLAGLGDGSSAKSGTGHASSKAKDVVPRSSRQASGVSERPQGTRKPYTLTIDAEDWSSRQGAPASTSAGRAGSGVHRGGIGPPPY
jgi:hypothetical protein